MTNNTSRKISLCITTYNRPDLTIKAFENVLNHPAITEVVIVDDNSTIENYQKLRKLLVKIGSYKIKVFRNTTNLDCYQNKKRAVQLASNDWVILFDSDNIMDNDYVNNILAHNWYPDTIIAPSFARPHFDYRALAGNNINAFTVAKMSTIKGFDALINTCNYFVNKHEYLKVHKSDINPHAADTCYFNSCWIKAGNQIYVANQLEYQHIIHDGSHYKEHNHKSNDLFDSLMAEFKTMGGWETLTSEELSKLESNIQLQQMTAPFTHTKAASIVTFKPMGRLGNFFFEAATAFAYAQKHGLEFSIPYETNDPKWNPIYLNHLLYEKSEFHTEEILIKEKTYFKYEELEFKEEWKNNKVIVLDGYFQNPKYFNDYADEIAVAFDVLKSFNETDVSIHIRRGDYLVYTDKHPAFSDEYMESAINYFVAAGFKKFIVFSDDIPWCRSHFSQQKYKDIAIAFQEGKSEIEDIIGIAACGGHINSSSTFSWWGAWLGAPSATTITPETWLLHAHANEWTDEIIPSNWIKMKNN